MYAMHVRTAHNSCLIRLVRSCVLTLGSVRVDRSWLTEAADM